MPLHGCKWIAVGAVALTLSVTGCGGGGGDDSNGFQGDLRDVSLYAIGFSTVESTLLTGRVAADAFRAVEINGFQSLSGNCVSTGTRLVQFTDNDSSGDTSAGDRIRLIYNNCSDTAFDAIVNGAIMLDVVAVDEPADAVSRQIIFGLEFQNFRVSNPTFDVLLFGGYKLTYRSSGMVRDEVIIEVTGSKGSLRYQAADTVLELLPGSVLAKQIDSGTDTYRFRFDADVQTSVPEGSLRIQLATLPSQGEFQGQLTQFPLSGIARFFVNGLGSQCVLAPASDDRDVARQQAPALRYDPRGDDCLLDSNSRIRADWSGFTEGTLFTGNDSFDLREDPVTPPGDGGGSGGGDPVEPPPMATDVTATVVELPAAGFDLVEDPARNRLYISLPTENEVAVIATDTLEIIERIPVGSLPRGLDLSSNGQTLYIALGGAGAVAYLDIDSGMVQQIVVAEELGDPGTFDVVEARPGEIFVSANRFDFAYLVKINRNTGNSVSRVADERFTNSRPELAVGDAGKFLYVGQGFSPNSLYKLDLDDPEAPVVAEDEHGSIWGTDRLQVLPAGDRIVLRSGQVLRTSNLTQAAEISFGLPEANSSGSLIFMARFEERYRAVGFVRVLAYETDFYREISEITNDCPVEQLDRLDLRFDEQAFYLLGGAVLCEIPRM